MKDDEIVITYRTSDQKIVEVIELAHQKPNRRGKIDSSAEKLDEMKLRYGGKWKRYGECEPRFDG